VTYKTAESLLSRARAGARACLAGAGSALPASADAYCYLPPQGIAVDRHRATTPAIGFPCPNV
jgi:hypothetical protein